MKEKLLNLVGKQVRVERQDKTDLNFCISGVLEYCDETPEMFYCRCKEDYSGTSGIEFNIVRVEEIQKSIYDSIIWIK